MNPGNDNQGFIWSNQDEPKQNNWSNQAEPKQNTTDSQEDRPSAIPPKHERCCCAWCYKIGIEIIFLWIAVGFIFACVVVLAAGGGVWVPAYNLANRFLNTTCVTLSSRYDGEGRCSYGCGNKRTCHGTYSCLIIEVNYDYVDTDGSVTKVTAKLYEDEFRLKEGKCAVVPDGCSGNRIDNDKSIEEYRLEYGQAGTTYECMYDPENKEDVFRKRKSSKAIVIHILTWPSVIFIITVIIIIIIVCKRGCDNFIRSAMCLYKCKPWFENEYKNVRPMDVYRHSELFVCCGGQDKRRLKQERENAAMKDVRVQ